MQLSRDGRFKKYTNKKSRENNRQAASLHLIFYDEKVLYLVVLLFNCLYIARSTEHGK